MSDPEAPCLGMVVNYYCNQAEGDARDVLVTTTTVSLRLLRMNPVVSSVLLVDGSAEPDPKLEQICTELDTRYLHTRQEVTNAEAYNIGWRALEEDYIGLMANDVIPNPSESLGILLRWLQKPDVGCVFPYLATGRFRIDEVQRPGFLFRHRVTCEPSSFTLNLCLFKRAVLEAIDGLQVGYVQSCQEAILLLKIRPLGYRVLMVGHTQAYHYDMLTVKLGASSVHHYRQDVEKWLAEYPAYATRRGIYSRKFWRKPFATTFTAQALWWLAYSLPGDRIARYAMYLVLWLEPFITRYPARFGHRRATLSNAKR